MLQNHYFIFSRNSSHNKNYVLIESASPIDAMATMKSYFGKNAGFIYSETCGKQIVKDDELVPLDLTTISRTKFKFSDINPKIKLECVAANIECAAEFFRMQTSRKIELFKIKPC